MIDEGGQGVGALFLGFGGRNTQLPSSGTKLGTVSQELPPGSELLGPSIGGLWEDGGARVAQQARRAYVRHVIMDIYESRTSARSSGNP